MMDTWMPPKQIKPKVMTTQFSQVSNTEAVIYFLCLLLHLYASLPLISPLLHWLWIPDPSPNFLLVLPSAQYK